MRAGLAICVSWHVLLTFITCCLKTKSRNWKELPGHAGFSSRDNGVWLSLCEPLLCYCKTMLPYALINVRLHFRIGARRKPSASQTENENSAAHQDQIRGPTQDRYIFNVSLHQPLFIHTSVGTSWIMLNSFPSLLDWRETSSLLWNMASLPVV